MKFRTSDIARRSVNRHRKKAERMNANYGITVKHVHADGSITYIGAISVQLSWPEGRPCYLRIECGDGDGRREASTGVAYIINAQGKTIDRIDLSQVAPVTE